MRGTSATPSSPQTKAPPGPVESVARATGPDLAAHAPAPAPADRSTTSGVSPSARSTTSGVSPSARSTTSGVSPSARSTTSGVSPSARDVTGPEAMRAPRSGVFLAYSHRDRDLLGELQKHLKPLQKAWMLDLWDDLRVDHGPRGAAELRRAIEATRVALLLISPGFLASPFVAEHVLPVTLAAQRHPRASVMCLYLRPAMDVFIEYKFPDPLTGESRSVRITNFHALNDPTCPLAALERPARDGILAAAAEEIIAAAHRGPEASNSEY